MPTKPNPNMAGQDGDIAVSGAVEQLQESRKPHGRVPKENAPRPKHKPMMPGDVK